MKLNLSTLAIGFVATGVFLVATPAVAYAGGDHPKPRGTCSSEGAETTIVTKDGPQHYRCTETKPNCLIWVWEYDKTVPKRHKSYAPPKCPCTPKPSASATPTPSHTPTATPTTTHTASPSATPTAGQSAGAAGTPATSPSVAGTPGTGATPGTAELPVTGPSWKTYSLLGLVLIVLGVLLFLAARESCRNGRKPKESTHG